MICDLCKDDIFPEDPIFCDRCYQGLIEMIKYLNKNLDIVRTLLERLQNREHYS